MRRGGTGGGGGRGRDRGRGRRGPRGERGGNLSLRGGPGGLPPVPLPAAAAAGPIRGGGRGRFINVMGHSPGRGGGRGANPSATAAAGAAAQSQSQSQQHLAAVREQWEAVQAMVAESERTAALLRERLAHDGGGAGPSAKRLCGGDGGAEAQPVASSPTRRKRQRPTEAALSRLPPPWRRFLPPYGPAASIEQHPDGTFLAALTERMQQLRTGPGSVGPGTPAAVGRAMELLVGEWARGRWGQGLLLPLSLLTMEGSGGEPAPSSPAGVTASGAAPAAEGGGGQEERQPRGWRDAQAVLCPFDLHGTCNDPECPHLHLSPPSSSSPSPTARAGNRNQQHRGMEGKGGSTAASGASAWRPLQQPLPPFRNPLLSSEDEEDEGDGTASSSPSPPPARGVAAMQLAEQQTEKEEQHEVAVLLGASPAAAAAPPGGGGGRASFAEQTDFVPLALLSDGDDGKGVEEEAAGAMDESGGEEDKAGGHMATAAEAWMDEGEDDDEEEEDGEGAAGVARYFAAPEAEPAAAAAGGERRPTSELEAMVASRPEDAEAWLALATRRLLLGGGDRPPADEGAAVDAALRALGVTTEEVALAAWLLRLEQGGGSGSAPEPDTLRPALRVLARALDALPPNSDYAEAPWLLYLRLYVALPTGGPPLPSPPLGLLNAADAAALPAPPLPAATTPVSALSPSLAGKADALLEAAREHNRLCLPLWGAAEAYHRLCRVPAEAAAGGASGADEGEGPQESLVARALRFHTEALVALQAVPCSMARPIALLLLKRAHCLLRAGCGAEAVRTLAVPLGALAGRADLAAALLTTTPDEQEEATAPPALPSLPADMHWSRLLAAPPDDFTRVGVLLLWAALLHLIAFGCLPPAALDLLAAPSPDAAWQLLSWHPSADASALAHNAAAREVAAAFRQWQGRGQSTGVVATAMEWNLAVLETACRSTHEAQSGAAAAAAPTPIPRWLAFGLGRLSTLRSALQLAAATFPGGGRRWLWRKMMMEAPGTSGLDSLPAAERLASQTAIVLACVCPLAAEEASILLPPPAKGAREQQQQQQEDEQEQQLVAVRDALAQMLGDDPPPSSSGAVGAKGAALLPLRSLQEEVVALGEGLLKRTTKVDPNPSPGGKALAALLLARLRQRCGGAAGPGSAIAGLRHYLLSTSGADADGAMERAALWLELLGMMAARQREAAATGQRGAGKGGSGSGGGRGDRVALSSIQQQMESAVVAAVRDLTEALPTTPPDFRSAVVWALDRRPSCRRLAALAVETLVRGVLGLHRWSAASSAPFVPDPFALLLPPTPLPLPSGALVVLGQATLAHALGRPSRAGLLFRLRAALRPRFLRRLTGSGGLHGRDSGRGGGLGNEDDDEDAAAMEAVCLAHAELALQELGPAQLALERGLFLDPLSAGAWAALLQLEASFGGGGGGGAEEREQRGRARLAAMVQGMRAAGVRVPMQPIVG